MPELRLQPNGLGTRGTWTTLAGGTTNLHLAVDDYSGGGSQNGDTDGVMGPAAGDSSLFLLLGDTPSGFDPAWITKLEVKIAYRRESSGVSQATDTADLGVQVFRSDEATAITGEVVRTQPGTSYVEETIELALAGTHTKADLDGARIRLRNDYTAQQMADTVARIRVTAVEVVVTYAAAVVYNDAPAGGLVLGGTASSSLESGGPLDWQDAAAPPCQSDLVVDVGGTEFVFAIDAAERTKLQAFEHNGGLLDPVGPPLTLTPIRCVRAVVVGSDVHLVVGLEVEQPIYYAVFDTLSAGWTAVEEAVPFFDVLSDADAVTALAVLPDDTVAILYGNFAGETIELALRDPLTGDWGSEVVRFLETGFHGFPVGLVVAEETGRLHTLWAENELGTIDAAALCHRSRSAGGVWDTAQIDVVSGIGTYGAFNGPVPRAVVVAGVTHVFAGLVGDLATNGHVRNVALVTGESEDDPTWTVETDAVDEQVASSGPDGVSGPLALVLAAYGPDRHLAYVSAPSSALELLADSDTGSGWGSDAFVSGLALATDTLSGGVFPRTPGNAVLFVVSDSGAGLETFEIPLPEPDGGTTYNQAPAGGLVLGGTASSELELASTPAGGLVLGGAAAAALELASAPAGGLLLGGAASSTLEVAGAYDDAPAGGPVLGGATAQAATLDDQPAGGLALGGQAAAAAELSDAPAGGLILNGAASSTLETATGYNDHPAGGPILGGQAASDRTLADAPTGGVVLGGTASSALTLDGAVAGGLVLGGTASSAIEGAGLEPAGGLALGGAATSAVVYGDGVVGGLTLGGPTGDQLVAHAQPAGGLVLAGITAVDLLHAHVPAGGIVLGGSTAPPAARFATTLRAAGRVTILFRGHASLELRTRGHARLVLSERSPD
jgi:hypothetical protein